MSRQDDTHGCEVPTTALVALADGAAPAPGLDAHVAGCARCRGRLVALRGQKEALARLAGGGGPEALSTRWRHAAARAGRGLAADLLAELARSSLAGAEAGARHAPLAELPRPVERIAVDLAALRARLSALDEQLPLASLPELDELGRAGRATPGLARACLDALAALEGRSTRVEDLRARMR